MGVATNARQTSSLTASWMVACAPQLQLPDSSLYMQVPSTAVDQLKQRLLLAVENGNSSDAIEVIALLEKSPLTKEILEATRIGATVNDVRKRTGSTHPDLSKKCRGLIKIWQKLLENRPSSSNGTSSNGGTPNTPAIRRGLTPQTPGRKCTPSARTQIASPGPNDSSYAPVSNKVSPQNGHLAKSQSVGSELFRADSRPSGKTTSPAVKLSKKRTAGAGPSPDEAIAQKRMKATDNKTPSTSPSTPQVSVLAARRQNALPTSNLLAQFADDPVTRQLGKAIQKPQTPVATKGQLERKVEKPTTPKIKVATPPVSNGVAAARKPAANAAPLSEVTTVHSQPTPSPSSSFREKEKEKKDKEMDKKTKTKPAKAVKPKQSEEDDLFYMSDDEPDQPVKRPKFGVTNWYANLPSMEELAARKTVRPKPVAKYGTAMVMNSSQKPNGRSMVVLPYADIGRPDFLEYKYKNYAQFLVKDPPRR
ncbi:hypothetical protein QR680_000087 [Steinernema hermaphroditum]|uniref:Mediator of RNA polymerase II transcription subunit 26 n=1 Tax=Steinernema hermaphroditum TaxID=289476 RepID=A0AA39GU53_9BILA|nr:hypothetical protein QR680_000087 [Steinernema hermaphroditum]